MESSVLHSMISLYEEQDNCLYFGLGLAVATSQILEALDKERNLAQAGLDPVYKDGQGQVDGETADCLLLFLLGLVSFSQNYQRSLAGVRAEVQQRRSQSKVEKETDLPRLALRDLLR